MPDRRSVLLGLGAAALTGCAAPGSAVYQVIDSYRALQRGQREYPVTREQIDGQSLGVLGVQVEGGLKGLMLWEKREAGLDYWRSGNQVALVLAHGRIVRSLGFPLDQHDSRVLDSTDPLAARMEPARDYALQREIDFAAAAPLLSTQCLLHYLGRTRVDLLGQAVEVEEWQETVRLSRRQRPWKQTFQRDASTGEVVRSVQHIGPELRVILEQLKAPAQPVG